MSLDFLQFASDTADSQDYTFSSQNFGDAAADRYIICGITLKNHYSGKVIDSVTIGGVAATILQNRNSLQICALAIALVPTGTSGDVFVGTDSGYNDRGAIALWRATSLKSATPEDKGESDANAPTYNIDVSAGGFVIAVGLTGSSPTATWTNVTEKYDQVIENTCMTGGSDEFATAQTNLPITVTFTSVTDSAGIFASWGMTSIIELSASDIVNFSDIPFSSHLYKAISDGMVFSDSASLVKVFEMAAADGISMSDAASFIKAVRYPRHLKSKYILIRDKV